MQDNFRNMHACDKDIPFCEDRTQIEAVKLALKTLVHGKNPVNVIVEKSCTWLLDNYDRTEDETFLGGAKTQMVAWLEAGYEYELNKDIFDRILWYCGMERENFLSGCGLQHKHYRVSKNRIRTIIGRWRRGLASDMKFEAVIDEMYDRMDKKALGRTEYISHFSNGDIFSLFELVISDTEYMLHDMLREKYYFFEVHSDDSCGNS